MLVSDSYENATATLNKYFGFVPPILSYDDVEKFVNESNIISDTPIENGTIFYSYQMNEVKLDHNGQKAVLIKNTNNDCVAIFKYYYKNKQICLNFNKFPSAIKLPIKVSLINENDKISNDDGAALITFKTSGKPDKVSWLIEGINFRVDGPSKIIFGDNVIYTNNSLYSLCSCFYNERKHRKTVKAGKIGNFDINVFDLYHLLDLGAVGATFNNTKVVDRIDSFILTEKLLKANDEKFNSYYVQKEIKKYEILKKHFEKLYKEV